MLQLLSGEPLEMSVCNELLHCQKLWLYIGRILESGGRGFMLWYCLHLELKGPTAVGDLKQLRSVQ